MSKKNQLLLFLAFYFFIGFSGTSQNITISGHIKDAKTGEDLIGATIYNTNKKTGTTTNNYGFFFHYYSVERYVGYGVFLILIFTSNQKVVVTKSMVLNIDLEESDNSLGDVVVNARRNDSNVRKAQMGVIDVPIKAITTLPAIGGENDVLKVIQLLPGVQSGKEGTTGFHVRGGNTDQNLFSTRSYHLQSEPLVWFVQYV